MDIVHGGSLQLKLANKTKYRELLEFTQMGIDMECEWNICKMLGVYLDVITCEYIYIIFMYIEWTKNMNKQTLPSGKLTQVQENHHL